MDASLSYLIRIVKTEIEHAESILAFLKEKESALIMADAEQFRQCAMKEQSMFVRARKLEESRLAVVEVIANNLKLKDTTLTLGNLIDHVDSKVRPALKELRERLRKCYLMIKHQNKKCEVLLKRSIDMINFNVGLLVGKHREPHKKVYGKDKRLDLRHETRTLLDRKG